MAGIGSRLRPHTLTIPKPLTVIAGKSIVQRLVEDIAKVVNQPIDEIAFIIGPTSKGFPSDTSKKLVMPRITPLFSLDNKVAIITGATSGMGLDTAKLFLEQGAKVVLTGRTQSKLDALQNELEGDFLLVKADASNTEDSQRHRNPFEFGTETLQQQSITASLPLQQTLGFETYF